jgi:hypothetical protein
MGPELYQGRIVSRFDPTEAKRDAKVLLVLFVVTMIIFVGAIVWTLSLLSV